MFEHTHGILEWTGALIVTIFVCFFVYFTSPPNNFPINSVFTIESGQSVSSVAQARVKVSTTRKAHGDPSLAMLECRASPIVPNELWIIKRGLIPPDPSEILDDLLAEED